MFGLESNIFIFLVVCILAAAIFEFINGFHDTANAVATVIYTNSMKPLNAVAWTGLMNFLGVVTGGVGVGMAIINLLPIDLLIDQNVYHSIAMVLALLLSAILWNFGTWFFGIPSSSSHTLIGSIMGVGLGYALLPENTFGAAAINWGKVGEIFTGLFLAPVIGFVLAMILMNVLKIILPEKQKKDAFSQPHKNQPPPPGIRATLITASTLVGFFHGKNDGQKGVGLIMLILISILPSIYAINSKHGLEKIEPDLLEIQAIISNIDTETLDEKGKDLLTEIHKEIDIVLPVAQGTAPDTTHKLLLRSSILQITANSKTLLKDPQFKLNDNDRVKLANLATVEEKGIRSAIDYAPFWVILLVSVSLGAGTMVGWKRIVVTVGEKIGKSNMNYAQGASSGLVAAFTIALASGLNLPVSTTHTLSSGIAGTMVSTGGVKNLDVKTIKNIGLTWLLTLPISIILGASLFLLFRYFIHG